MRRKTLHLLFIAVSVALPACSKEPKIVRENVESKQVKLADHEKYLKWHNICLEGDTSQIALQIKKFENELAITPDNNLARAYLGSAYALKAKHSFLPTTKLRSLKKGKALLEAAVEGSPKDARVRMVRAIAYYKVPKRFGTHPTSLSDFEILLKAVQNKNCALGVNEKQAILYYAYLAFSDHKHDSSAKAKQLCHKLNPQSKYGKLTK